MRLKTTLVFLLLLSVAGCSARATDNPARAPSTTTATTTDAPPAAPSSNNDATPTPTPTTPSAVEAPTTTDEASPSSTSTVAAVADWSQWRGPNRDGNVTGAAAPKSWPKELKEEWKAAVGVGHSSPVYDSGRVFIFARRGDEETLAALDPSTGKELWKSANAAPYEMNPAARGHGKGPKSTPVVWGGRVYTLGITGVLSAHDVETGRLVWRKEFSKQYPSTSPLYGTSMSPLVENRLVIAHVGGHDRGALTAFDAKTGAVKWSFEPDGPAYSSPVAATLGGTRQIITFTQKEFVSVSADFGELLWKLPAKTAYDTNCVTPIVYKDTIIFALEDGGVLAVRPTRQGKQWKAEEVWRNTDHSLYMNTPVVHGNLLFGLSARNKGQLFALDAGTGKTVWQGPGRAGENASLLNLAGTLLVLLDDATLLVQPADANGYAPAARYTVATSPTWAHPLVLGDRLLVKDETTLRALSLK
jgi:outer membrane protein assembly factor BamB